MSKQLKVWWIPQVPMRPFEVPVSTVQEGVKLMKALADYDAFQFENLIKPDYCNAGGLMQLDDDGEWTDWVDDETGENDPVAYLAAREVAP